MKPAFLLAGAALIALLYPLAARAQSAGIAAVVNNDAITAYEVDSRETLTIASAGLHDAPDIRQKLRAETINMLIEERLMMQEGAKDDVTAGKDEIDKGLATVAQQNNWSADQFRQMMEQSGIPVETLNNEIESQIVWGKVIQKEIRPTVEVTEAETNEALARLKAQEGKPQYLVAEIVLPVAGPADDAPAHQLADKIYAGLNAGQAPFDRVAQQFSQAPGATKGGDLGWVQQGQLAPEIDALLPVLKDGQIGPPVRTRDGWHIILRRKSETLTEQTLPSADDLREKIGIGKLDRAQKHLMQELKSSAFIEKR